MDLETLKEIANENIHLILDALGFDYIDKYEYYQMCCPIHGGDNPTAFSWVKDRGYFRCFTRHCERDGADVFDFIQKYRKCTLMQAKDIVSSIVLSGDYKHTPEAQLAAEAAFKRYIRNNHKPPKEFQVIDPECIERLTTPNYLLGRGFSQEVLDEFNVGYCDNPKSYFYDRDCIPIFHHDGPLVGFTGRITNEDYTEGREAKWFHTPSFPKGQTLFNLHRAKEEIARTHTAILVEGPLDVLKFWMAGIYNVVAVLGSDLSGPQRSLLLGCECYDLILAFDNDISGKDSTSKVRKTCKAYFNMKQYLLPDNHDVGDLDVDAIQHLDIYDI
jgi:DNA primase